MSTPHVIVKAPQILSAYKNIILLGANGSGKGTAANKLISLSTNGQLVHLGMSNMIRFAIANDESIRDFVVQAMEQRNPVDCITVLNCFYRFMKAHDYLSSGCIFDGIPRTPYQADELKKYLAEHRPGRTIVVELHLHHNRLKIALDRCQERYNTAISQGLPPRKDDIPELAKKGLDFFQANRKGVIDSLEAAYPVEYINASMPKQQVVEEILKKLEANL